MTQFRKKPLLEGIQAALQADATILAFAPATRIKILRKAIDYVPDWIVEGGTGVLIKLGSSEHGLMGTITEEWTVFVDIIGVSMKDVSDRLANQDEVLEIDDDLRRVLVDDTTVYSESGVEIELAEATEMPPIMQVWGELYEDEDVEIGDASGVRMKYEILQNR